jgi:hypothetical protein
MCEEILLYEVCSESKGTGTFKNVLQTCYNLCAYKASLKMTSSNVEAGWNTSIVALRIVEGVVKGIPCLGGVGHRANDLTLLKKKLFLQNPKEWKPDGKSGRIF